MSLYDRLVKAGYPESEMYSWQSDLYVYVTPLTTRIIEEWCKENRYARYWHCPIFKDQITGRPMYDCIFQYAPWWDEHLKRVY